MTAVLERETVSFNLFDAAASAPLAASANFCSSNTSGGSWGGSIYPSQQPWVTPNTVTPHIGSPGTIYIGTPNPNVWQQSPPFAPVQQSPFEGLEALGRVKDFTVPTHNYEPHCDILGNPVGCKHCSYANVHKLDPASHPFTIYEEA